MGIKVALVQDWLTGMRGGEKVLEVICNLYPQADLFTLLHQKGTVTAVIENRKIQTSFLQKVPLIKRYYRYYLPLMPRAIESFNLSDYDLIISSSHCVAKGVRKPKKAVHICYCHTPMRYVWDMYDAYFGIGKTNIFTRNIAKHIVQSLRKWDIESSQRVDFFIANSFNVSNRIHRYYNRLAKVIYPPVDTDYFTPAVQSVTKREDKFYLVCGSFAPYKRVDLAIATFNQLKYPLIVIGSGQEEKKLKQLAKSNVKFVGWGEKETLRYYYRNCQALIFPGLEDFGIVPVEVQACGRPVIAYGKGGVEETVSPGKTGVFFTEQTVDAMVQAIRDSERIEFNPTTIRNTVLKFNYTRFSQEINEFIVNKTKSSI